MIMFHRRKDNYKEKGEGTPGMSRHIWIFSCVDRVYVVIFCPRPMEGMGRLQFSDIFPELPVSPHAAGVVDTF